MVNGPNIVFKVQKTQGASVPLVCGCIGRHYPRIGSLTSGE
jgi:hypothetical protein